MPTILLIDDDEQVRTLLQDVLEECGYHVLTAANGTAALRFLQDEHVDLILVDIFMPGLDGLEIIQQIRKTGVSCKIVAMSGGSGEWNYLDVATHLGADATLMKPFDPKTLLEVVSNQIR